MWKLSRRHVVVITAVFAGVCIFGGIFAFLLTQRVDAYVNDFAAKVSQSIATKVEIGTVATRWEWLSLRIHVQNLKVFPVDQDEPCVVAEDIIATVDLMESLRSFGVRFKSLLLYKPRLTINWDGSNMPTIVGMQAADAKYDLDSAVVFKVLALQRHIKIVDGDLRLQGRGYADLPLHDVKLEFIQRRQNEHALLARGKITATKNPEFNFAMNIHGSLTDLPAAVLDFALNTSNLQIGEIFNFIPRYQQHLIGGGFDEFSVSGTVHSGSVRDLRAEFLVKDLSINQDTVIASAAGQLHVRPSKQQIKVIIDNIEIVNKKWFTKKMKIEQVLGWLNVSKDHDHYALVSDSLQMDLYGMRWHPEITIDGNDAGIQNVGITARFNAAPIDKVKQLLPDAWLSKSLHSWMQKALLSGMIERLDWHYGADGSNYKILFKDVELRYVARWPSIHELDAVLEANADQIKITATHAKTLNQEIRDLRAQFVAHNAHNYGLLTVHGNVDASLQQGLEFLQHTPFKADLGAKLAGLRPDGRVGIDMDLRVDFTTVLSKINFSGLVDLQAVQLQVADLLTVRDINGKIAFSDDMVQADRLTLSIMDHPAVAKIAYSALKDAGVAINIDTELEMQELKKLWPLGDLKLSAGKNPIAVRLILPWHNTNLPSTLTLGVNTQKIIFGYNPYKQEFNVNSKNVVGSMQISPELDKVIINLQKLILMEDQTADGALTSYLKEKHKDKSLPLIEVYAENLQTKKYNLRNLQLQLLPRTYGYEITDLAVEAEHLLLQAQGQWQMDKDQDTQLSGNIYTNNLSQALAPLGYNISMQRGKAELNFAVHWPGGPLAFSALKVDGTSRVDIRSGTLTGVDPGLGRVIGLLNVESIQRRLNLDFSDVFNRGLAFDRLTADLKLRAGTAVSNNIQLHSPSARIELAGSANLRDHNLDFTMLVVPKMGASVPVAAALAVGNPAVGAALWLLDRVSGSRISELHKYKYRVGGTWEAPDIIEISDNSSSRTG